MRLWLWLWAGSEDRIEAGHRERTAQMIRLAELMAAGEQADAAVVQTEIEAQYQALTALRAVSGEEFRAIGRSCAENEQWRSAYEAITSGLAAYQRDAIDAYVTSRPG